MRQDLGYYVNCFTKLRTDRSSYRGSVRTKEQAPHKALLLLSVIAQFEQEAITTNLISLTPDLNEIFRSYWSYVMDQSVGHKIVYPFFHLRSEGFWHLVSIRKMIGA